ncbi:cation diffusion facilitator family transporter [Streptomyces sp. KR80]|uniref:cation diffusion facilitator family transporter n=1 Tax=Streptomyces sp. KR80 TaxID=3457426 RepID=UPI003FD4B523
MSDQQGHAHQRGRQHERAHEHGHDHDSASAGRTAHWVHQLRHPVKPHSHESADKIDHALESSAEGMRALWISLAVLGATAVAQAIIFAVSGAMALPGDTAMAQAIVFTLSGSVALLGDTVHHMADVLTALPLAVAFAIGRRAATRRFTYGYGRAEDLAGIAIVLTIAASAVFAAWTAVGRLLDPRPMESIPAVAIAAVVGFAGNEWVARYRIRVGSKIGSAALIADGLHARTDGFTSLAVLLAAGGAALDWQLADPIVGLAITAAILLVLRDAAREVFRRVMDAVDPTLVNAAENALKEVAGVRTVGDLRLRWIGHRLRAEVAVVVDGELSLREAHQVAVEAERALLHAVPRLTAAPVHVNPAPAPGTADHRLVLVHHGK